MARTQDLDHSHMADGNVKWRACILSPCLFNLYAEYILESTSSFLERKAKTNLNRDTLKCRDTILLTKVHIVKAMVFPVVVHGCESWAIKKTEHQRIDIFELWCWRRLVQVPWTVRRSNQSIIRKSVLNIHWKDLCRSWNSNILATWCKELTHWKRPWCWERLRAGEEGDDRG